MQGEGAGCPDRDAPVLPSPHLQKVSPGPPRWLGTSAASALAELCLRAWVGRGRGGRWRPLCLWSEERSAPETSVERGARPRDPDQERGRGLGGREPPVIWALHPSAVWARPGVSVGTPPQLEIRSGAGGEHLWSGPRAWGLRRIGRLKWERGWAGSAEGGAGPRRLLSEQRAGLPPTVQLSRQTAEPSEPASKQGGGAGTIALTEAKQ